MVDKVEERYILVDQYSKEKFVLEVNSYISKGYKPVGDFQIVHGGYMQAMYKDNKGAK